MGGIEWLTCQRCSVGKWFLYLIGIARRIFGASEEVRRCWEPVRWWLGGGRSTRERLIGVVDQGLCRIEP